MTGSCNIGSEDVAGLWLSREAIALFIFSLPSLVKSYRFNFSLKSYRPDPCLDEPPLTANWFSLYNNIDDARSDESHDWLLTLF